MKPYQVSDIKEIIIHFGIDSSGYRPNPPFFDPPLKTILRHLPELLISRYTIIRERYLSHADEPKKHLKTDVYPRDSESDVDSLDSDQKMSLARRNSAPRGLDGDSPKLHQE